MTDVIKKGTPAPTIRSLDAIEQNFVDLKGKVKPQEVGVIGNLLVGKMPGVAQVCARSNDQEIEKEQSNADKSFGTGKVDVKNICNTFNSFRKLQGEYKQACEANGGTYMDPTGDSFICILPRKRVPGVSV